MARTVLTVEDIDRVGFAPTFTAMDQVNGHSFDNTGRNVFIYVKNSDTASHTVTITTPGTVDGLAVTDLAVSVPNADERVLGPFPVIYETVDTDPDPDIDPAIFVDVDDDTGMTIAVLRLPDASY